MNFQSILLQVKPKVLMTPIVSERVLTPDSRLTGNAVSRDYTHSESMQEKLEKHVSKIDNLIALLYRL